MPKPIEFLVESGAIGGIWICSIAYRDLQDIRLEVNGR